MIILGHRPVKAGTQVMYPVVDGTIVNDSGEENCVARILNMTNIQSTRSR